MALQFVGLFVCSCWGFVLPIKQERNIEVKKYSIFANEKTMIMNKSKIRKRKSTH